MVNCKIPTLASCCNPDDSPRRCPSAYGCRNASCSTRIPSFREQERMSGN